MFFESIKKYLKEKIYIVFLTEELAKNIAKLQQTADVWFYVKNDKRMSEYFLSQVTPLKNIATKYGIGNKVYVKALNIYNFSNSGKSGYTLKNGKIVKEEAKK